MMDPPSAIRRAVAALVTRQHPDGHWDGMPDGGTAAEYILRGGARVREAAAAILAREPEWAGVKGYCALKAAGIPPGETLRRNVLAAGGIEAAPLELKAALRARGLYPDGVRELFVGAPPAKWRNLWLRWFGPDGGDAGERWLDPVWDTAMAALALEAAPEPPGEAIARARRWLGSRPPLRYGCGSEAGGVWDWVRPAAWPRDAIVRAQQPDGSWASVRGFIHGTCLALRALGAAGESDREAHMLRGGEWLRSIQNSGGGWGETCAAEFAPGPSKACETAWALLGLIAGGDARSRGVHDGIAYLVNTQRPDGGWDDPYGICFPLLALSEFIRV
ncbi:MAG: prenyltransferase/squalene oxidase repeat-containing protein [Bryobacteraceae bacterium]